MAEADDMLDRLAAIVRDAVTRRARARMRLAHPDPETEAERRFLDELAAALLSQGGVDVLVCSYAAPRRVGLVRAPEPLFAPMGGLPPARRSTLIFHCEADRDTFFAQLGAVTRSDATSRDTQVVRLGLPGHDSPRPKGPQDV